MVTTSSSATRGSTTNISSYVRMGGESPPYGLGRSRCMRNREVESRRRRGPARPVTRGEILHGLGKFASREGRFSGMIADRAPAVSPNPRKRYALASQGDPRMDDVLSFFKSYWKVLAGIVATIALVFKLDKLVEALR